MKLKAGIRKVADFVAQEGVAAVAGEGAAPPRKEHPNWETERKESKLS